MARGRRPPSLLEHSGRRFRAHPPVERLPRVGMGDGRFGPGALLLEAVRLGDHPQRPHPPDHAEGGGARRLPHRGVDRVPSTRPGNRAVARPHEGPGRSAEEAARPRERRLRPRPPRVGRHRHHFGRSMTMRRAIVRDCMIVVFAASCAAAGYALSAGLAGAADEAAKTATVKIDNFSFGPVELKVPVGTTVTWTNRDDIPHTVVSTDKVFKSKVLDTDEKFSFTFSKAGTYPYFCSIHPKMTGKVVVQ